MEIKVPSYLTEEQIEKFQKIYKQVYGKDISKEEAEKDGMSIIRLVAIVLSGQNDSSGTNKNPSLYEENNK